MYAACEGQSAGATIRRGRFKSRPSSLASSSAVDGRTAPSRWQCSSALGHAKYGEPVVFLGQGVDVGQLAVKARVVKAVADHEPVGDDETAEIDLDLDHAPRR